MALAVLATGIAAVFGMAINVSNANRTMVFQTRSLDAFARLSAQIENAQCDFDPTAPALLTTDPGLGTTGTWIDYSTRPGGTTIDAIGTTGVDPTLDATVPQMHIEYRVTLDSGTANFPALDVEVRIREVTHDPTLDALTTGYYVRNYPVRKLCNPRLDATKRGEYLP